MKQTNQKELKKRSKKVDRRSRAYKQGFKHGVASVQDTMYIINEDNMHWAIPKKHKDNAELFVKNYKNKYIK